MSSSPHAAAKLGDTKELESFISMLDQELAGMQLRELHFLKRQKFTLTLRMKKPSERAGRPCPPSPTFISEFSSSVNGISEDHLHNLQC